VCSKVSKQPQKICITLHTSKSKWKTTAQQCKISVQNRQKGSQKLFSGKSYGPSRKMQQLSRDARQSYQQERAVGGSRHIQTQFDPTQETSTVSGEKRQKPGHSTAMRYQHGGRITQQ
jgi:hypothetical protein